MQINSCHSVRATKIFTLILSLSGVSLLYTNCSNHAFQSLISANLDSFSKASIFLAGTGVTGDRYNGCELNSASDDFDNMQRIHIAPRDCSISALNPPFFSWLEPDDINKDPNKLWRLEVLNSANATVLAVETPLPNSPIMNQPFQQGAYSWRVIYFKKNTGEKVTSKLRKFYVPSSSTSNQFIDQNTFLQRVQQKSHPRIFPKGMDVGSIRQLAQSPENLPFYNSLIDSATRAMNGALPENPESKSEDEFPNKTEYKKWLNEIKNNARFEARDIQELAFLFRLTGKIEYRDRSIQKALNLSSWDPNGITSFEREDIINQIIFVAQADCYDLLYNELSTVQKDQIFATFRVRILKALSQVDKMVKAHFDSHSTGSMPWHVLALIKVEGDQRFPEAEQWLKKSWGIFLHTIDMFGGSDGSFGNSISYGWYRFEDLASALQAFKSAVEVDLTNHPHVRNYGRYLTQMTPPLSTNFSAFGDGAEKTDHYKAFSSDSFRIMAYLTGDSEYEWYWGYDPEASKNPKSVDIMQFISLASGLSRPKPKAPVDWQGALFPDSGVVSIHSDIADPQRSSVYFRSSSLLGAISHSHADQNSFTLVSKGKDLLISSGYYANVAYGDPHHANVTRATRYKNTVTFDGGIGQDESSAVPVTPTPPAIQTTFANGNLINYYNDSVYSAVTGDATLAYRGTDSKGKSWTPFVDKAYRSLVYLRERKTLLVYDYMSSSVPRSWELNFHALNAMTYSNNKLLIQNQNAKACLKTFNFPSTFSQTSKWDVKPDSGEPEQYHARFTATKPTETLNSLTIIQEDCTEDSLTYDLNGMQIIVRKNGDQWVAFDQKSVMILPNP